MSSKWNSNHNHVKKIGKISQQKMFSKMKRMVNLENKCKENTIQKAID